jgi:hypothetical protein
MREQLRLRKDYYSPITTLKRIIAAFYTVQITLADISFMFSDICNLVIDFNGDFTLFSKLPHKANG